MQWVGKWRRDSYKALTIEVSVYWYKGSETQEISTVVLETAGLPRIHHRSHGTTDVAKL